MEQIENFSCVEIILTIIEVAYEPLNKMIYN